MKAVILAGGRGTRISEETNRIPKPMVRIGDLPILVHIMDLYSMHGIKDFVVCCGYKSEVIRDYFSNFRENTSDFTIDLRTGSTQFHSAAETRDWRITIVDTGLETMTGGRILQAEKYLGDDSAFCMTYGDGLSDVNITRLIDFHNQHGKLATVTAVPSPGRFGAVSIGQNNEVKGFEEKQASLDRWINGGFFILERECLGHINGPTCTWEDAPLQHLAEISQLEAFRHTGFWHPMDTLKDKEFLESLWNKGNTPWTRNSR